MVDIVLIVTSSIFSLLIIISAFYFVVYFQNPDDKWSAWFPKIIVILGLSIAAFNVLLLPLDVANQRGEVVPQGGLPMRALSLGFLLGTVGFGVLFIPFTSFYYEGMDAGGEQKSRCSQLLYAFKWMVPILILVAGLTVGLFFALGTAEIPVAKRTSLIVPIVGNNLELAATDFLCTSSEQCSSTSTLAEIQVNAVLWIVAVSTVVGWSLFAVFGGIGLVALPIDMIKAWIHRPVPITNAEYQEQRKLLGEQSAALMTESREIEKLRKAPARGRFWTVGTRNAMTREKKFLREVGELEGEYNRLQESFKSGGGNILLQFASLVAGILGLIVSLAWMVHGGLYLIPGLLGYRPFYGLLNEILKIVQPIPFLGVAMYCVLVFWLLLSVVKGNAKLGMRLLFVKVHPLKYGDTLMTSLLFNVGLVLFASLALAQFATLSLADYVENTPSSELLGVQLKRIRGFEWIFNGLVFAYFGFQILTIILLVILPVRRKVHQKKA